jgi:uncharacterized protein (TIGR00725 family)
MDAASRGARKAGGVVVGILPGTDPADASPGVTVPIPTGLGEARDAVVALAARVVIACGMSAGTAAEAAHALKAGRPLVLVTPRPETLAFFVLLGGDAVRAVERAEQAVAEVARLLGADQRLC